VERAFWPATSAFVPTFLSISFFAVVLQHPDFVARRNDFLVGQAVSPVTLLLRITTS
jgi:hypothetical protein